jgi:hypothetical protein
VPHSGGRRRKYLLNLARSVDPTSIFFSNRSVGPQMLSKTDSANRETKGERGRGEGGRGGGSSPERGKKEGGIVQI